MKTIMYPVVAATTLVFATSAHAALTTYECTLTMTQERWQQTLNSLYDISIYEWDSPVTALPPGDRFTLRFTVDGSAPMYTIPASWPLEEYGTFSRPVITAGSITPWATNVGAGLGRGEQMLDMAGQYEMLYGSAFTSGGRIFRSLSSSFYVDQLLLSVQGPTYSRASVGLGLDQIYGPLNQGRASVWLSLSWMYEVSTGIGFDVSDFRIVPAPGAAALCALAGLVSTRRRR